MADNPTNVTGMHDFLVEPREGSISFAAAATNVDAGIKASAPRPGQSFNRASEKPAKGSTYEQQSMGNQFMINLMLMLTQLIDPGNKNNKDLMNLITKAFGLGKDDADHSKFRQLKEQTATAEGRKDFRENHDYSHFDKNAASQAMRKGTSLLGEKSPQNPSERQGRVIDVMDDAAKSAGISTKLMIGVWGFESTWGKNLKSPTGCLGDFQFSRVTMVEVMSRNGDKIADRLRTQGMTEQAEMADAIHAQTKGMSGPKMRKFADNNRAAIDALRMDPEISTYAAAAHLKSVAKQLRVDPNKTENFGIVYAGYNIGVGNARKIMNGERAAGWEVDVNRSVAGASNQAASYQNKIMDKVNSVTGQVVAEKVLAEKFNDVRTGTAATTPQQPEAENTPPRKQVAALTPTTPSLT